jgi:hypothetical protein
VFHPISLRALIIITNADATLRAQPVSPEPANVDISLRQARVRNEKPSTKDRLGKNVKNSVGNDLGVDAKDTSTVGYTPDTANTSDCAQISLGNVRMGGG